MYRVDEYINYFEELEKTLDKNDIEDLSICKWYYEDEDGMYLDEVYTIPAKILGTENWNSGCSKFVFSIDAFPEVVFKIPFIGMKIVSDETVDNLADSWEFCDEIRYEYDYCCIEESVFLSAWAQGLDKAFAPMRYLIKLDSGIEIYVQERLPYCYRTVKTSEKSKRAAKKIYDKHENRFIYELRSVIPIIVEQYGILFADDLVNFFIEQEVGDLHSGNIRLTKDGKLKFSDYSGFEEDV